MISQRVQQLETSKAAGRRYYERWRQLQASGAKPVVIHQRNDAAAWQAWKRYFSAHQLWTPLDLMNDGRTEYTVPCLDPMQLVDVLPDRRVRD